MNTARQIEITLKYNNNNITKNLSEYLQNIVYYDYEENISDELIIKLKDADKILKSTGKIQKGAKLTCSIKFSDSIEELSCGTFTIDEISYTFSSEGEFVEIKSLATTPNFALRTKNSLFFEKISLGKIAEKIGFKYGFKVSNTPEKIFIERVNQISETDLKFLKDLSKQYGYIFKITDNFLTFINIKDLTEKESLFTFTKEDIKDLYFEDISTKKYKSCTVRYFNPQKKQICTGAATKEKGTDTLKIYTKCFSKEQAENIASAKLNSSSKEIRGEITLKEAKCNFIAGINFTLSGFGDYDKKYHLRKTCHRISNNGWEITGEFTEC